MPPPTSATNSTRGITWGGFTLIELLAVIVLISMAAAIASVGLVSSSTQAQMQAAAAGWRNLDAQARLAALSEGPLRIEVKDEVRLLERDAPWDSGERLGRIDLPSGCRAEMTMEETPIATIHFDSLGRSVDYAVRLVPETHDQSVITWRVCGLTGWVRVDNAEPLP